MTYTQITYQIVFGTKYRERTLEKNNRDRLFKYITGIIQNKRCHLYQIGGIEDHIHIVTDLHPMVSLSSLVKDIKIASTEYAKREQLFPAFRGWQEGYGAFTYNKKERDRIIEYVKRQEEHHHKLDFKEEYIRLLGENGVKFDEKHLL
jgi:putative transposase